VRVNLSGTPGHRLLNASQDHLIDIHGHGADIVSFRGDSCRLEERALGGTANPLRATSAARGQATFNRRQGVDLQPVLTQMTVSAQLATVISIQSLRMSLHCAQQQDSFCLGKKTAIHVTMGPTPGIRCVGDTKWHGSDTIQDVVVWEASQSLHSVLPLLWGLDRQFRPRAKTMASRIRNRAVSGPSDLFPAAARFLTHRVNIARHERRQKQTGTSSMRSLVRRRRT